MITCARPATAGAGKLSPSRPPLPTFYTPSPPLSFLTLPSTTLLSKSNPPHFYYFTLPSTPSPPPPFPICSLFPSSPPRSVPLYRFPLTPLHSLSPSPVSTTSSFPPCILPTFTYLPLPLLFLSLTFRDHTSYPAPASPILFLSPSEP